MNQRNINIKIFILAFVFSTSTFAAREKTCVFDLEKLSTVEGQLSGRSPNVDFASTTILDEFSKQPSVKSLLDGNPRYKATLSSIKDLSRNGSGQTYYRAAVEVGYQRSNGQISFGTLPTSIRLYDFVSQDNGFKIYDVTEVGFPQKTLWGHFSGIGVKPEDHLAPTAANLLIKAGSLDSSWYYRVIDDGSAEVYVPILTPELALSFRRMILSPSAYAFFWIHRNGVISLETSSPEESDGTLGFGIMSGGIGGWSPWNAKFIDIVDQVDSQRVDQLKISTEVLMPPLIIDGK